MAAPLPALSEADGWRAPRMIDRPTDPGPAGAAAERPRVARVVADVATEKILDYEIPETLHGDMPIGSRVRIPLGKRTVLGTVVGLAAASEFPRLRPVESVVRPGAYFDAHVLAIARWIADYYGATYEQSLAAALPAVVRRARRGERRLQTVYPKPGLDLRAELESIRARAPRQAAAVELLIERGPMLVTDLVRLAGTSRASLGALERRGLVRIVSEQVGRDPFDREEVLRTEPLTLNDDQAGALREIAAEIDRRGAGVFLLHGVTGSGKTEVYLQSIARTLEQGRGAIVLVPEIALTPQTTERFRSRFGETVAVLHSELSEGERHDEWFRLRDGAARIAIGARSAVFAPVQDLGLIVVDEEHETTYKQAEAPRYHARDVAVVRGRQCAVPVVLGSATPSLESFHNARSGKYRLLELPKRIDGRSMPELRAVDMRAEALRAKAPRILSQRLVDAIEKRLERGEQTILFLNRRGYATSFLCPKCGFVANCPDCSIPFTVHRRDARLLCHLCGISKELPAACPNPACRDPSVKLAGVGTEKLEATVGMLFPKARVERMDSDTTTRRGSHRRILSAFRSGKIDILVGTQMIAKGLDFPNVTLVGIVFADQALHHPDFRSGERTFQLVTQVAGRAGRGEIGGEVIVQTYTPGHAAIRHALAQDFLGFYEEEIGFREALAYPPVGHMVLLGIRDANEQRAMLVGREIVRRIEGRLPGGTRISGPAPAPIARVQKMYRYQVVVRGPAARPLIRACGTVVQEIPLPRETQLWLDVDAVFLM